MNFFMSAKLFCYNLYYKDGFYCARIMYNGSFSMFSPDGYIYSSNGDEKGKKCFFEGQLGNLSDFYVGVSDGEVFQYNVLRDGNDVSLIRIPCCFDQENIRMINLDELENMFKDKLALSLSGEIYESGLATENDILEIFKAMLLNEISDKCFSSECLSFLKNKISNCDINDVPCDFKFMDDEILLVDFTSGEFKMEIISVWFMKSGVYKISSKSVILKKYSFEKLKEISENSICITAGEMVPSYKTPTDDGFVKVLLKTV